MPRSNRGSALSESTHQPSATARIDHIDQIGIVQTSGEAARPVRDAAANQLKMRR
jgi:hypothetical protein